MWMRLKQLFDYNYNFSDRALRRRLAAYRTILKIQWSGLEASNYCPAWQEGSNESQLPAKLKTPPAVGLRKAGTG
jgi:hypothetical protein